MMLLVLLIKLQIIRKNYKDKIKNAVSSTSFSKLKEKKKMKVFLKHPSQEMEDTKIPFFNLGPKNNWKKILMMILK